MSNAGPTPDRSAQHLLYVVCLFRVQGDLAVSSNVEKTAHSGEIFSLDPTSANAAHSLKVVLRGCHLPDSVAICQRTQTLFWTQMGNIGRNNGAVLRSNLDGSDVRFVLEPGICHTPKQLCLDCEAGKIYISDREGLRIHSTNFDGSAHEVLVATGDWKVESSIKNQDLWCVGVAISKRLGKIFWTQKGPSKGSKGRIMSANLQIPAGVDAATRNDIKTIIDSLPEPVDLDIDDEEGAIYWTDRGEVPFGNTLNKMLISETPSTSGPQPRKIILAYGFGEAIGLQVDKRNDCVWVADLCGRVWRCDRQQAPRKIKIFEDDSAVLAGLAMG